MGRQAFLLVAMEEFSLQDAALVLEMRPHEVSTLLEDANQDIAAQIAVLIMKVSKEYSATCHQGSCSRRKAFMESSAFLKWASLAAISANCSLVAL